MSIKWGSTYVTVVKWGGTTCTQVKWGSTVVFPTATGYNGSSYDYPIASGFNNGLVFNFNFKTQNANTGYLGSTSNNTINFSLFSKVTIVWNSTKPTSGNACGWGALGSNGYVQASGTSLSRIGSSDYDYNLSSITSNGTLYIRPYFQYDASGKPNITVTLTVTSIVFS